MDQNPSRERSTAADLAPRVSAVVVTRHTGQTLELCLRSALAEPWIDELIIVDNGNPAQVSSALRALQADRRDIALIKPKRELGIAEALNVGAGRARGRWLMFIDPHVVLQRGAAERMVAAGGGVRSPWLVGGRLTDTNGRERRGARRGALTAWSSLAVALDLQGRGPRRRRSNKKTPGEPLAVAAVSGAFMLAPAKDFHELGGFDEGFATDAADLDICRRAGDAGGVVLFQPAASGVQFAGGRRPGKREAQGLARFAAKSAKTPGQRAFALIARPALALLLGLRSFIGGRPPPRK
ncbi:MAG: glycosyltransferase family 2 protein [Caulobacterales bacterium]